MLSHLYDDDAYLHNFAECFWLTEILHGDFMDAAFWRSFGSRLSLFVFISF
jgi:hypothetical protein